MFDKSQISRFSFYELSRRIQSYCNHDPFVFFSVGFMCFYTYFLNVECFYIMK